MGVGDEDRQVAKVTLIIDFVEGDRKEYGAHYADLTRNGEGAPLAEVASQIVFTAVHDLGGHMPQPLGLPKAAEPVKRS